MMGGMGTTETEGGEKTRRKRRRKLFGWIGLALVGAAVVTELRKPKQDRTWHGELAGFIPYDLRFPTPARVKASFWSPDDPRWLLPRAAGVGWSPNLGRAYRLVSRP
jgi:hypothetical protein